ncbi:M20/M25/M40 family metallo-hydrolase [Sedimentibacter hydroxybenzoicus DSM 7310]|uniref:M20/M25/M40 family metallo-hydrolase n=1 Tax=Sedimentibacter hydroxybenzoicus DSM 7310 TaxID=1123245 RepID=A0A974GY83_SEDHY|nr:M20/M25/M40 family metallo-hydrolase [Sedimentibacter hydroxybenzoicus]NYB75940.1 M20/M25/M40 family metallo-hydrolase [Sedimentibacter hydroxybenzoicus DSM 7310]
MINQERLINVFMEYVQIDSETKNEKAISKRIINDLKDLGYEPYTDEAGKKLNSNGNNVYCFIPGTNQSESMLFSAHMDTVTPGNGIVPYIDGNYIKSKGDTILGGDDKAGITAIIEALRTIKENNLPHRPIEIVFTICEEGGVNGVKEVEFSKLTSKKGIVLDSGGSPGKIIIEAPGQTRIFAEITGKPSHAGVSPEKGISAITVAAEAVTNMNLLRIDSETTANIGTFKAVGATNIVSPLVEIVAEARSRSTEKLKLQTDHMVKCLQDACDKYGAALEYNIEYCYLSYAFDSEDEHIKQIESVCEKLGLEAEKIPSGGGSDANVFNLNGIKAVNVGAGMELAHTTDEQLNINDFINASKFVFELMTI